MTPAAPAAATAASPRRARGSLFEQSLAASAEARRRPARCGRRPAGRVRRLRARRHVHRQGAQTATRALIKAAYGELVAERAHGQGTYGDAFAEARIRYGLQGEQQDLLVDLREAYVNAYVGPFDLRLGQQIIVWGRADAFNPTNNLTPFDLRIRSPIEDDRRLGNVGARANLRLSPVRLEGVWMPLYRPSELPRGRPARSSSPSGARSSRRPRSERARRRARLHLELSAFELSVSYLRRLRAAAGLDARRASRSATTPRGPACRARPTTSTSSASTSRRPSATRRRSRAEAAYRRPVDYQNALYAARPDAAVRARRSIARSAR